MLPENLGAVVSVCAAEKRAHHGHRLVFIRTFKAVLQYFALPTKYMLHSLEICENKKGKCIRDFYLMVILEAVDRKYCNLLFSYNCKANLCVFISGLSWSKPGSSDVFIL